MPQAVPYFVSFVILGAFTMLNLFVAVVLEEVTPPPHASSRCQSCLSCAQFETVGEREDYESAQPIKQEDLEQ